MQSFKPCLPLFLEIGTNVFLLKISLCQIVERKCQFWKITLHIRLMPQFSSIRIRNSFSSWMYKSMSCKTLKPKLKNWKTSKCLMTLGWLPWTKYGIRFFPLHALLMSFTLVWFAISCCHFSNYFLILIVGWWFSPTWSTSWGTPNFFTDIGSCRPFSRLLYGWFVCRL